MLRGIGCIPTGRRYHQSQTECAGDHLGAAECQRDLRIGFRIIKWHTETVTELIQRIPRNRSTVRSVERREEKKQLGTHITLPHTTLDVKYQASIVGTMLFLRVGLLFQKLARQ